MRHTLENLGRVSDDPANLYSRFVYGGIPGHILIASGLNSNHLALWNIASRTWRRFGKPDAKVREITSEFICTATDGTLDFYDPHTFEPLDAGLAARLTPIEPSPIRGGGSLLKLSDGSRFGLRGQEYFHVRKKGVLPELKPIPTPRPATDIFALTADANGTLWGASNFGQTIFWFDPATRKEWNSQVVCDVGGEVYGMQFARSKLFLAAYCGGDHIVYDPTKRWDQLNNINPRTLQAAGPALIRPEGRSVIGPDGHFWTGWMAAYGTYGGGLSRVNVDTLEVKIWYDPVPKQAVASLAAGKKYLFFSTSGEANGLSAAQGAFHFVVWDPAGGIVRDFQLAEGEQLGAVAAVGDRVLLRVFSSSGCEIRVFSPQTLEFEGSIKMDEWPHCILAVAPDRAAVFTKRRLLFVNPMTSEVSVACEIPGGVRTTTLAPRGELYFATGLDLYRLRL
jgi:hypothetical protein